MGNVNNYWSRSVALDLFCHYCTYMFFLTLPHTCRISVWKSWFIAVLNCQSFRCWCAPPTPNHTFYSGADHWGLGGKEEKHHNSTISVWLLHSLRSFEISGTHSHITIYIGNKVTILNNTQWKNIAFGILKFRF